MLYDTRWDAKTKADPFTLESFAEWLGRQPRWKRYNYVDPCNCAAAQYCRAMGIHYTISESKARGWEDITNHYRQTFGAAARRARRVLFFRRMRRAFGIATPER